MHINCESNSHTRTDANISRGRCKINTESPLPLIRADKGSAIRPDVPPRITYSFLGDGERCLAAFSRQRPGVSKLLYRPNESSRCARAREGARRSARKRSSRVRRPRNVISRRPKPPAFGPDYTEGSLAVSLAAPRE